VEDVCEIAEGGVLDAAEAGSIADSSIDIRCGPGTVLVQGVCEVGESGVLDAAAPADSSTNVAAADATSNLDGGQDAAPDAGSSTCALFGADGDAGNADLLDAAGDAGARALHQLLSGITWQVGQSVAGMAVDAQERVYLSDNNNVYLVSCESVSVYMTAAEAAYIAGVSSVGGIQDLDIAPDGSLYILLWDAIVRSTAPHQVEVFKQFASNTLPHRLGVIDNERVAVTDDNGLTVYSATGAQLAFLDSQIDGGQGCAVEDLTTAPSGIFLYAPGCNLWPLLRGNVDGLQISAISTQANMLNDNFICSARDPSGGFFTVVRNLDNQPTLYHVDETAPGASAFVPVTTSPSLIEAQMSTNETFAFDYCSLAVGPDGRIFLQTMSQLWSISPQ
jgi:hypothetical protein